MMLSDTDIYDEMRRDSIIIDPWEDKYLQPASYDVHLDNAVLIPKTMPTIPDRDALKRWREGTEWRADMALNPAVDKQPLRHERLPFEHEGSFYLPPGGVALGCTSELLTLNSESRLAADIAGCSSLGRWWLAVHMTAGFIDPGWSGKLTLELFNASPWWLKIWAGMRIAQLRFYELRNKPNRSYLDTGHYGGAVTVLPADYHG